MTHEAPQENVCPDECKHLEAQHENALGLAQTVYKLPENDGKIGFYINSEDPRLNVMWTIPVINDDQKQAVFDTFGLFLQHRKATSYTFMTLGWMVQRNAMAELNGLRVSEQPDKIEVLMVITQDQNASINHSYEVVRNAENELVDFKLLMNTFSTNAQVGNKLGELFNLGKVIKARMSPKLYEMAVYNAEDFLQEYVDYGEGISSRALASSRPSPH